MPNRCAAYGCKSGNRKCGRQEPKVTLHKFPMNQELRNVWIRRISRTNFVPSVNSRLCSLHFHETDFITESNDTNTTRRRSKSCNWNRQRRHLKPDAVPSNFPNMPAYFSHKVVNRPSQATTSSRQQNMNARFEDMETKLFEEETITTIDELIEKYSQESRHVGFIHERRDSTVWFHHVDYETFPPRIDCSIAIGVDLKVAIFDTNAELPKSKISHIIKNDTLNSITELLNIMAFLKAHAGSHFSQFHIDHKKQAILSLKVS